MTSAERIEDNDSVASILWKSQIMRGCAVLFVIALHVFGRALSTTDPVLRFAYVFVHQLASCAVPMFFVLSGFSLSLGRGKRRNTIRFVVQKILPNYTFWYFLYSLLFLIKHSKPIDTIALCKDYILLSNNGNLWFLVAIAQLYILFPFLYRLYQHEFIKRILIVAILAFVQVFSVMISFLPGNRYVSPYFPALLSFSPIYFCSGFYLKEHGSSFAAYAKRPLCILGCVAVVLCTALLHALAIQDGPVFVPPVNPVPSPTLSSILIVTPESLISAIISIGMFVLIYSFSTYLSSVGNWATRTLQAYGLYSYGIYLSHALIMALSYSIVRLAFGSDNDFVIVSNFIVTAIGSFYLVKWLSKMPLSRLYI